MLIGEAGKRSNNSRTALMYAAENQNIPLVQLLQSEVNMVDGNNRTAFT